MGSLWRTASGPSTGACWLNQVSPPSVDVYSHTSLVDVPGPGALRSSLAEATMFSELSGLTAMLGSCCANVVASLLARTLGWKMGLTSGFSGSGLCFDGAVV